MQTTTHRFTKFIYGFFFLSGMTGLVYQVLWSKYLSNIFGSSAYAHTIVLAVFMGGLAFGNYYLGRFADRSKIDLLYLYAMLEIGIGIYCMLYPNIADGIEGLYVMIGHKLAVESTHGALLITQFILNAVTIFIPTTLMGGTLPIMVKYITKTRSEILNKVSVLYFINSGGAVLGSLFCGFFFIRLWGLDTSISFAATINILIGLFAWGLSSKLTDSPAQDSGYRQDHEPDLASSEEEKTKGTLILWAIGISGFVSMLYEVMWIRTLIQFFGSSVYSFAIVVAAFIAGITLGSAWLAGRQQKTKDVYLFFSVIEGLIAVTMYLAVWGLASYFTEWIWFLHRLFSSVPFAYPFFLFSKFLLAFTILFVPCFFIGMTLPLASAVCSRNIKILGQEVGGVFSANTIGAVLGTSVAGLIFLPWLGVATSFLVGILINMLLAIVLLFRFHRQSAHRRIAFIFCLFLIIFLVNPIKFERSTTLSSMFRYRTDNSQSFKQFMMSLMIDREIMFYKEDINANVAVMKGKDGLTLFINGKPDASSSGDMPTQLLSGHIPALLHKNPKKALVIGFGSGVTVGSLTLYPSIEQIDCLEISKGVIEAGVYFKDVNYDVLNNKRVRIIVDDAKSFLSFNKDKYDIIISEPTNPWTAGTGSLLTQEAFERIRKSLNTDGVFLQWFHGYEMSPDLFRNFAYTLTQSFPFISIWSSMDTDYFFVSHLSPLAVDPQEMKQRMESNPLVMESLGKIKANKISVLLSTQIMSEEKTWNTFRHGVLNKDRFPLIEFNAPKAFFLRQNVALTDRDERMRPYPEGEGLILSTLLNTAPLQPEDILLLYNFFKRTSQEPFRNFTRAYAEQLRDLLNDDPKEKLIIEKVVLQKAADAAAISRLKELSDEKPESAFLFLEYLKKRIQVYRSLYSIFFKNEPGRQELEQLLSEAQTRFPDAKADVAFQLASFYAFHSENNKAFEEYYKIIRELGPTQDPAAKDKAKEALLLGLDLSVKEKDVAAFRTIAELTHQYFSDNPMLLGELKRLRWELR